MRFPGHRLQRNDRGAALVEFIFVAPLLMLLFIASANVGLAVVSSASGTNAAREAGRVATIRYECADNHVSARCPNNPSTNYNTIKAAAVAKLGGLVPANSVTLSVVCRQGSVTGAIVTCEKANVKPDHDVVVVTLGWSNMGASQFVPFVDHSTQVVMTIVGRPDLTALQPEPDVYPPATSACEAKDSDADGDIDKVEITFDEDIVQSVSAAAFSIANSVNGSNAISSASVSGRVVTLSLTGTTVNTAPGSMTVSLAASASGVRDTTGNQGSFSGCVLADKASPKLIGITDSNLLLGGNGKMGVGDSITFTFSEPIGLGLGVVTVTETDPNGGGNDTLTISGITAGAATTNSNSYISSNDTSQSYTALAVAVGKTVVVELTAPTCGLCLSVGNGSDSAPFNITVSTSLGDASGNPATGTGSISNVF